MAARRVGLPARTGAVPPEAAAQGSAGIAAPVAAVELQFGPSAAV
jgi:hypothetical protein